YHLFPNVMLATFPATRFLVIIEPLAVDRTLSITYVLGRPNETSSTPRTSTEETPPRGLVLVNAGAVEDREVTCSLQRGLSGGAHEFLEFGRFESAMVHFHRALHSAIDGTPCHDRA